VERLSPIRVTRAALLGLALALVTGAPAVHARQAQSRAATEPAPARVAEVALVLPPGEPAALVADLVAIRKGDPLSPRSLRRTVQLLFQTGRFLNVIVRAEPATAPAGGRGEWVRLEITCVPLRILSTVSVRSEGPHTLADDALREATGLAVGAAFDEAELEAALGRVRAALARRGHRGAEVDATVRGDRSVAVEVRVLAGPPTLLRSIRLEGAAGPGPETLLADLRSRSGERLDEDALAADVRDVRARLRAAGYRRARVGEPVIRVVDGGAEVELPVDAGPLVTITFRGQEAVDAEVLARQLGLADDQPLDAPAVDAAADRLHAFYRARGYAEARVEPEERRRGRTLEVVFHVAEGRRFRLGAIRIEGVAHRDPAATRARLLELLEAEAEPAADGREAEEARALLLSIPDVQPSRPPPPSVIPASTRWDAAAWDRAGELVADDYRVDGHLDAAWLGAVVELDARRGTADVTARFHEGPRTRVESIAFDGNAAVSLADLVREARFAPGEPLSWERIEETRLALLRLYLGRGHLYARIDVRERVEPDRSAAVVRYEIAEGPVVRIGRIVVNGNRRTREDVVRRALAIREGDVYDPEAIARSQTALLRLNVFRSVGLRVQEPETPAETKDLAVEVSERPWQTLAPGIGFSYANGPRTFVEYGLPNIAGRALELTARAKVNYPIDDALIERLDARCVAEFEAEHDSDARLPSGCAWWKVIEGRADVGLRNPRVDLFPIPTAVRADLIGERLHRKAYDLTRVSGITGLDFALTDRMSMSLQYEAEIDDITKNDSSAFLTQADLERLRFDEGVTTLHSIQPSFALDFRDNAAHPHRGWFAAGTVEYARSIGDAGSPLLFGLLDASEVHTNLAKVHGTLSGYLPVSPGTVVALSVRGGQIFPLDERSRTIIPKRFFLGGASSMRGYGEDEMLQQDVRPILAAEARHCATSLTGIGCTDRGRAVLDGKVPTSEGGQAFLLVKSELRVQLRGAMEMGLFLDLGNLWYRPEAFRLLDLRANVGAGLRFATPIGPAAIDVGFNVAPDDRVNERTFAPHFTIGLF
jgi:outer membrane protein insertion porin family